MVKQGNGVVAAIGNFDGVHRGHRQLLARTQSFARQLGGGVGVVLFEPHPRRYFRPDDPPFLLTESAQRDALLRSAGVEEIIALTFDNTLASLSPEAFVTDVLVSQLGIVGAVTGSEFRFGKDRAGDAALLQAVGAETGLKTLSVTPAKDGVDRQKIGSSAIRAAIRDGDVVSAADMLGRLWSVVRPVVEGQRLGRTLGFPTANMTMGELIEPRHGVYAVDVAAKGETYGGVANFGRKPTVGAPEPLLEVHVLDFEGDLYGRELDVAFVDFIRDERKFDGLQSLKTQIAADARAARHILAHRPRRQGQ